MSLSRADQADGATCASFEHFFKQIKDFQSIQINSYGSKGHFNSEVFDIIAKNSPNLTNLNITRQVNLTTKDMQMFFVNCKQLKTVSLSCCKDIVESDLRIFVTQHCCKFELTMNGCNKG
jgi:type VI protein secretion system component Hcp